MVGVSVCERLLDVGNGSPVGLTWRGLPSDWSDRVGGPSPQTDRTEWSYRQTSRPSVVAFVRNFVAPLQQHYHSIITPLQSAHS
jgi:hypothetical protein